MQSSTGFLKNAELAAINQRCGVCEAKGTEGRRMVGRVTIRLIPASTLRQPNGYELRNVIRVLQAPLAGIRVVVVPILEREPGRAWAKFSNGSGQEVIFEEFFHRSELWERAPPRCPTKWMTPGHGGGISIARIDVAGHLASPPAALGVIES